MESFIKGIQFPTQVSNWSTGVMHKLLLSLIAWMLCEWQYYKSNVISRYEMSPAAEAKEIFSDIPSYKYSLYFLLNFFLWYISALFLCSVCPLRTFLQLCMKTPRTDFADYFVISRGNQMFRPLERGT